MYVAETKLMKLYKSNISYTCSLRWLHSSGGDISSGQGPGVGPEAQADGRAAELRRRRPNLKTPDPGREGGQGDCRDTDVIEGLDLTN